MTMDLDTDLDQAPEGNVLFTLNFEKVWEPTLPFVLSSKSLHRLSKMFSAGCAKSKTHSTDT
jgi:hypothetical protein